MDEQRPQPNLGPGWGQEMGRWLDGVYAEFRGIGKHRGGFPNEATTDMANWWGLSISNKGLWVGQGLFGVVGAAFSLPTQGMKQRLAEEWFAIESVEVVGAGRERVNKMAVATFGILGIGAKRPLTNMMIRLAGKGLYYFELDGSEAEWQAGLEPVMGASEAARKKVTFGLAKSAGHGPSQDPVELLERLADLRDRGVITNGDFERKKQDLLDKL